MRRFAPHACRKDLGMKKQQPTRGFWDWLFGGGGLGATGAKG
jgi:hypothetical protein